MLVTSVSMDYDSAVFAISNKTVTTTSLVDKFKYLLITSCEFSKLLSMPVVSTYIDCSVFIINLMSADLNENA